MAAKSAHQMAPRKYITNPKYAHQSPAPQSTQQPAAIDHDYKDPREEELKIFFRQHDLNGDGVLDKNELKAAFRRLGVIVPNRRASRSLLYADANGDGRVSEEEMDKLVKYAIACGYTVKEVGYFRYKL